MTISCLSLDGEIIKKLHKEESYSQNTLIFSALAHKEFADTVDFSENRNYMIG